MNRDVMMARFARDLSLPRALFSTSLISITVFENNIKSRIQHCQRSEGVYILSRQKFIKNAKNWSILARF